MGILAAMAMPGVVRMLQRQETKTSATEMAGLLSDARSHAISEGTPHLVYFNPPSVDANGNCGVAAIEVTDRDHSYSITDGDDTREFRLPSGSCQKVKPYAEDTSAEAPTTMPMPREDLAAKASDASLVGAVASATGGLGSTVAGLVGGLVAGGTSGSSGEDSSGSGSSGSGSSGSGSSGSGSSGSGKSTIATTVAETTLPPRTSTVADTVVNGATFPVDATSGRPVIAFSEHGIPVDPADPNAWGSGAGGIYLTDGTSTFAALVAPLGDVKLRAFDPASQSWR
jgi:type II secretory pathway pseudopilin PulG